MNRHASLICLLSIVLGLLLVIGVVGAAQEGSKVPAGPGASVGGIAIGMVTDEAGVGGDYFNWLSYQGLLKAESQLGITGTVYTPTNSSEYTSTLQQCVTDGNAHCISTSWQLREVIMNAARGNPGSDFTIIDQTFDSYPANLRGADFALDQVGYLAGVLAGLMTESDVVGDIGAMPISTVEEFVYSYRNGAQCANPEVRVLIEYSGDFGNPALGAEMAQAMMVQGADVIFAPAGYTSVGAVLTATQSGVWGIGVDTDFYYTVFGGGTVAGADKLLSSALKRYDSAVFETISDTVHSTFISGTVRYGLDEEGVSLAPFHDSEPAVPQSVKDALVSAEAGIIDGSIDLADDCREYNYMPVIIKPD